MSEIVNSERVKIVFKVDQEDGIVEIESLWAVPASEGYKIENVPFCAWEVACGDIVSAKADEDGGLNYTGLILASGHSTLRLWFADESKVEGVRAQLLAMGCSSELDLGRLVAVDVPPSVPYAEVQTFLEAQEAAKVFEYEEACLGQD